MIFFSKLLLEHKAVVLSCLVFERAVCFLLCIYTFEFFMNDLREPELWLLTVVTVEQRFLATVKSITWYTDCSSQAEGLLGPSIFLSLSFHGKKCGLCMIRGTPISQFSLCMALNERGLVWRGGGLCILGSDTKLPEIICQIIQEDLGKENSNFPKLRNLGNCTSCREMSSLWAVSVKEGGGLSLWLQLACHRQGDDLDLIFCTVYRMNKQVKMELMFPIVRSW